jgi:hypothetical protein
MSIRFLVPLDNEERDALTKLANAEWRSPQFQAAHIIRQKLEEVGLIKPRTLKREAANNDHN